MSISVENIKKLREETGVGIMDCKQVLKETEGDMEKAKELLREQGKELFEKRTTSEGRVASYIHHSGKIGSLVEVACETDFTATNDEFKEFANNLAMHIAAASPEYISPEDVPESVKEKEKDIYRKQVDIENKPDHVIDQILEGKLKKYLQEVCLLKQEYVKDSKLTIEDMLGEISSKFGEKVAINGFTRFETGEKGK